MKSKLESGGAVENDPFKFNVGAVVMIKNPNDIPGFNNLVKPLRDGIASFAGQRMIVRSSSYDGTINLQTIEGEKMGSYPTDVLTLIENEPSQQEIESRVKKLEESEEYAQVLKNAHEYNELHMRLEELGERFSENLAALKSIDSHILITSMLEDNLIKKLGFNGIVQSDNWPH